MENLGPQDLDHDAFVWFSQPLDIGTGRSTRIAAARASYDFLLRQVDAERRVVDLALVDTYLGVVRPGRPPTFSPHTSAPLTM